jgi:hypothetical protein
MENLLENQILINNQTHTIHPLRVSDLKGSFYGDHIALKEIGLIKLVTNYSDGLDVVTRYIKTVFRLEEVPQELIDNLDREIITALRDKVNKINEMEDPDPNA